MFWGRSISVVVDKKAIRFHAIQCHPFCSPESLFVYHSFLEQALKMMEWAACMLLALLLPSGQAQLAQLETQPLDYKSWKNETVCFAALWLR